MMNARWLDNTPNPAPPPPDAASTPRITARVERYSVSGSAATYFVRAESQGSERTLGVTYEQCRRLHERLRDEGGAAPASGHASRHRRGRDV